MNNKVIAIIVILIVIIGGIFLFRHNSSAPTGTDLQGMTGMNTTPSSDTNAAANTNTSGAAAGSGAVQGSITVTAPTVKSFTVTGSNFAFAPSTMSVNKGDTVKIHFTNSGGNHDFVIDEYNVRNSIIAGGQSADVTFVADNSGTFSYYCSVGNHRQMGMQGTLTVN
ncbi:MAG: Blue (Type 1) copper protein [Parcubacteria group bacterium]|nr:Blue (Type 1) copper protein [Parcubacteria group bacterium]